VSTTVVRSDLYGACVERLFLLPKVDTGSSIKREEVALTTNTVHPAK
jgi:hypothetical protein